MLPSFHYTCSMPEDVFIRWDNRPSDWQQFVAQCHAAMLESGMEGVPGPAGPAGIDWQGPWADEAVYLVDDTVEAAGSAYISIEAHVAMGENAPPSEKWELLASKGDTGATGATGSAGATGSQGIQGATGS